MGKKIYWIHDFSTTFNRVDGFLQINEEEAKVVRLIFALVHKGQVGFQADRQQMKPAEKRLPKVRSVRLEEIRRTPNKLGRSGEIFPSINPHPRKCSVSFEGDIDGSRSILFRRSWFNYRPAVTNGILYVLKTGCAWADLPRKYGSYTTCWHRLKEWQRTGIWERIWRKLLDEKRAIG